MEEFNEKNSMEKIKTCIDNIDKNIDILCMIIHNTPEGNTDIDYCLRLLSRAAEVRKDNHLLRRTFDCELK